MNDRDRLTQCGFRVADVPFRGVGGRLKYFASRPHVSGPDRVTHFFVVDLSAGTLSRQIVKGATYAVWSIDDACVEFGAAAELRDAPFLDRLRMMGFKLLRSDGSDNFWGSIGDGSKWLIHTRAEKLTRFDCSPIRFFYLDGSKLLECSNDEPSTSNVEQKTGKPQKTSVPPRSMKSRLAEPIEHSGANVAQSLFA